MEMIGNQELCAPRVKDLNLNSHSDKQPNIKNIKYDISHNNESTEMMDET